MLDQASRFVVRFPDRSPAQASQSATKLRDMLLDASAGIEAVIEKEDTSTMDLGATLVLVLGTPAVIALARGIAAFIARERASLRVTLADGSTVTFDGNSGDAAKIAAAMSPKPAAK